MYKVLFSIIYLFSIVSYGQKAQLKLEIKLSQKDSYYNIYIFNTTDTIYTYQCYTNIDKTFDSLKPGNYKLNIYNLKDQQEPYFTKSIILLENKKTFEYIDLNDNPIFQELNAITANDTVLDKTEIQLTLGYFDSRWLNNPSNVQHNFSVAFTQYFWSPLSKHIGFLVGFGAGYSQHYFANDTANGLNSQYKKLNEKYSNLSLNPELKIRISSGNQKLKKSFTSKCIIDLGVGYYFPLFFRHTILYEGNTKLTNRFIHQYTDFRGFVNIGYYPFTFFAEYRPLDFIQGNYQEIPKYNAGIRLLFDL